MRLGCLVMLAPRETSTARQSIVWLLVRDRCVVVLVHDGSREGCQIVCAVVYVEVEHVFSPVMRGLLAEIRGDEGLVGGLEGSENASTLVRRL